MSNPAPAKIGISALKDSMNAVFDLVDEGFKIKKSGVQSAAGDIFGLYSSLSKVYAEKGDVGPQAKDLDAAEIQELATLFSTRFSQTLVLAGLDPNSDAGKKLAALPRALALAQHVYAEGKEIYAIAS